MTPCNHNRISKLKAFLEQASNVQGMKNGEVISSTYDPQNPHTWEGIVWNDDGDCFVIDWSNKKHLSGKLNLDDFQALSFLFLDDNRINSLSTRNCFNLEEVTCKNNNLSELDTSGCYTLHTLKITGNPLKEITLIACDRLQRSGLAAGRAISLQSKAAKLSALSHESDSLIPFLLKSNNYDLTRSEYHHYRNLLRDRQIKLNNEFSYTTYQVTKIEQINILLDQKYRAAIKQAQNLCAFAQKQVETDPFVSDYEIDFKIDIYASKKFSHIPEMEGIPIYSGHPTMGFTKLDFEKGNTSPVKNSESGSLNWFLEENHNEFRFRSDHPLKNQHHCWLLHELYDHTYLAWQDILDMEEIWVDVGLVMQHCGEV
ncbi:hypothetical protein [Marinilabilia salmonicolor]|uniref:Leucine rich repeat (LRR) protein n=1 Tax=Marinilabilia salmonicolor TaxID=989 RepID=A0A368UYJ3_9BACT|nr:hypothetical protein [Marinilabilia salmonicolor]RCW33859.1 hypothetical protein DFO77_11221 [Marinilabilia salmonicolor]